MRTLRNPDVDYKWKRGEKQEWIEPQRSKVVKTRQKGAKGGAKVAREHLTDEQVEQEIAKLQESQYVKLANKERRVRNRRRMYLYGLRQLEKRGQELAQSGVDWATLADMERETYEDDSRVMAGIAGR